MLGEIHHMTEAKDDCQDQPFPIYSSLLTNLRDRQKRRYWSRCLDINVAVKIRTITPFLVSLNLDFINNLVVLGHLPSPLARLMDQWNTERNQIGTPQPTNSELWIETLKTLDHFDYVTCDTCEGTCGPHCLGVYTAAFPGTRDLVLPA